MDFIPFRRITLNTSSAKRREVCGNVKGVLRVPVTKIAH
jgi:hypothetical protein